MLRVCAILHCTSPVQFSMSAVYIIYSTTGSLGNPRLGNAHSPSHLKEHQNSKKQLQVA